MNYHNFYKHASKNPPLAIDEWRVRIGERQAGGGADSSRPPDIVGALMKARGADEGLAATKAAGTTGLS